MHRLTPRRELHPHPTTPSSGNCRRHHMPPLATPHDSKVKKPPPPQHASPATPHPDPPPPAQSHGSRLRRRHRDRERGDASVRVAVSHGRWVRAAVLRSLGRGAAAVLRDARGSRWGKAHPKKEDRWMRLSKERE